MSLADELLAALEDGGQDEDMEQLGDVKAEEDITEINDVTMQIDTKINSIHSIAKLRDSEEVFKNKTLLHFRL